MLSKEIQHQLRKRLYNFDKSNNVLKALDKRKSTAKNDKTDNALSPTDKPIGCVADDDLIRLRTEEKKTVYLFKIFNRSKNVRNPDYVSKTFLFLQISLKIFSIINN